MTKRIPDLLEQVVKNKRLFRQVTKEELTNANTCMFHELGLEIEDVESMAKAVGIGTDDLLQLPTHNTYRPIREVRRKRSSKKKYAKVNPTGNDAHLVELQKRLALVRDRVRGVAIQGQAGFYLYGRAGISKTYTVRTTLDQLGVDFVYQNGHITPIGLFELFEENPDRIIVLDDVGPIFDQQTAKGILLAALGAQPNGKRVIRYKRKGLNVKVEFTGGIIAISNLELHGDELMNAIKSRIQPLNYDPTDEQIIALMRDISKNGWKFNGQSMTPNTCITVCKYLLVKCAEMDIRPEVRMLVDKAFPDYLLWKSGESETYWKDLINSALEERLVELKYPVNVHIPSKKEEAAAELDLLEKICREFKGHDERLREFKKQSKRSKRTYHRRLKQLKSLDRL